MAVQNNLLIFAANTTNKMDDATYSSASQRQSGVQANQSISSSLNNTAMRSATLILKALIDSLITNSSVTQGSISTNSSEADVKSLLDSLISGLKVSKASGDGDGDDIAKTYAVDLDSTIDNNTGVITLQLLAKTATEDTRKIGSSIQIDLVPKASALVATTSGSNADYKVLLRPEATEAGNPSKVYYSNTYGPFFNPSSGLFRTRQVSAPTQYGNYVTCDTPASYTAKTISLQNFALTTGAKLRVKFVLENTASAPTLNVNSTGAHAIKCGVNAYSHLNREKVYELTYDGSSWQVSNPDVVDEARSANMAEKLRGFSTPDSGDGAWQGISFSAGTSSKPFSWSENTVVEAQIADSSGWPLRMLGVFTLLIPPSSTHHVYSPMFTMAGLGLFALSFAENSVFLEAMDINTGSGTVTGMGRDWKLFIRKVQTND